MAKHFINGEWVDAASGRTLPMLDPSTGEPFDSIARGDGTDIDRAVAAARAALSGDWGRLTATERGRILVRMGAIMLERLEPLRERGVGFVESAGVHSETRGALTQPMPQYLSSVGP